MNSEDSEWLERPNHPLLNNLILGSVFEQLRAKELMTCRLVCKTWNVLTIPFIGKTIRVTIHGHNPRKVHTIQKFVDVFRSNNLGILFPFARFQLGSFSITDGDGQEFLKLCGDTTKEIRFLQENYKIEDVSELLRSTPSLEVFEIPGILNSSSGNVVKLFPDGLENSKSKLISLKTLIIPSENRITLYNCCPTFLEELLTAAQNIFCLNMSSSSSTTSFEVLSLIEKLGRESSIQDLEISVSKSDHDEYAELLLRMTEKSNGLRLKRFRYNSRYSDQDSLALQAINRLKDTLEYLHVVLYETRCPSFTQFPKMLRLTRLTLSNCPEDFKFRGVNLNEIFPLLRDLTLWHWRLPNLGNDEFFPDSAPCPNMNALLLEYSSGMTLNAFNQMLIVFPNLTKLKIRIGVDGAEILRQIWSRMTQLESLDIVCDKLQMMDPLDSVLTGISTDGLQEMKDVVKNLEEMTSEVERREMIWNLRNQHSTIPSITNLTRLSSLSLYLARGGVLPNQGKFFTDLSGYFAFYSMKCLKHLNVVKCELTKTCCEILRKDMGLETWTFKSWEYKDIIPCQS